MYKDIFGISRKMPDIIRKARYKERYSITIDKEGYEETIEIRLAEKDNLFIENTKISIVIIRGFGQEPMVPITNVEKSAKDILEIYLTRWKCEES